jgi:predicted transport protein
MDTGNLKFMMFYARFAAGLGFDIMLKNYGDAQCKGSTSSLGINGWYANGQAYAYFQGKIGIAVKLPFYSGNYDIIDLGAAAVLQAKLPNPLWMQGNVGGYYSILGGMVKGNCKFQVTIGQQCEIVGGSALSGIKVIADITPANGTKDVNVFNAPQAVFNMPVDKEFDIVDLDGFKKSFKIVLDEFSVKDGATALAGAKEWNEDNDVVAFNTVDVLPSKKDLKVKVKISFQEKKNGLWTAVKSNGSVVTEEMEVTFTSGVAPDYIPLNQVAYSYPVINQLNYYKDESSDGYIALSKGMPHLFQVSKEWKQIARVTSATGDKHDFPYSVSNNKDINFKMPSGLSVSKIYTLELVNVPAQANKALDANVDTVLTAMAGVDNADIQLRTKDAEGELALLEEKSIYTAHFRTSQFTTFKAKLNSLTVSPGWSYPISVGIHEIGVNIEGKELFDKSEVKANGPNSPLVEFSADLSNTWYANLVQPLVYQGYPVPGTVIKWRRELPLGIPPTKAIEIRQEEDNRELTEGEVVSNSVKSLPEFASFVYNLPYYMYKDYQDLRTQAAASSSLSSNAWMLKIVSTDFPSIRSGDYKVTIRYVLPGRKTTTTQQDITIKNP